MNSFLFLFSFERLTDTVIAFLLSATKHLSTFPEKTQLDPDDSLQTVKLTSVSVFSSPAAASWSGHFISLCQEGNEQKQAAP